MSKGHQGHKGQGHQDVIEDMLCIIPEDAILITRAEIAHTEVHILQRPADTQLKTGMFYAHMHNHAFDDFVNIQFQVVSEETKGAILKQLFFFYCNWLVVDRDTHGYTIH